NASSMPPSYHLSLHDALPISVIQVDAGLVFAELIAEGHPALGQSGLGGAIGLQAAAREVRPGETVARQRGVAIAAGDSCLRLGQDRKSTRLNSSHVKISYAVF